MIGKQCRCLLSPAISIFSQISDDCRLVGYGIYLYHLIGLYLANAVLARFGVTSSWAVLLLYDPTSVLIAQISYRTLEARFRRFRGQQAGPGSSTAQ